MGLLELLTKKSITLRKELRPSKTFLKKAKRVHWERYNNLCDFYDDEDEIIE